MWWFYRTVTGTHSSRCSTTWNPSSRFIKTSIVCWFHKVRHLISQGSFTLSDFSKREACDFFLATMDTGIFNNTIRNERFPQKNRLEKWCCTFLQKLQNITSKKIPLPGKIAHCERVINFIIAINSSQHYHFHLHLMWIHNNQTYSLPLQHRSCESFT